MEPITKIAEKAGIDDKYLEQYGKYKAKIDYNLLKETDKKDGKLIRSSSLLIRDEKRELIGALCINVDTTQASALMQLAENLLNGKRKSSEQEHLEQTPLALANSKEESVRQFVNTMVDSMVKELIVEGKNSREDRLELIRFMDERGVFLVKGSMEYVAGKLGLSKVTLYGYLDEIHGKR